MSAIPSAFPKPLIASAGLTLVGYSFEGREPVDVLEGRQYGQVPDLKVSTDFR
jgi:hypothetical protein